GHDHPVAGVHRLRIRASAEHGAVENVPLPAAGAWMHNPVSALTNWRSPWIPDMPASCPIHTCRSWFTLPVCVSTRVPSAVASRSPFVAIVESARIWYALAPGTGT